MKINNLTFLSIALLLANFSQAQSFKKNRIGYIASIGSASYTGDLTRHVQDITFLPNLGVGTSYRLSHAFGVRAELNYFKLGGEASSINSDVSFKSNNGEFSTMITYDINPEKKSFVFRRKISTYIFAGLGVTYYNAHVKATNIAVADLRTINQSGYAGFSPVIPLGLGFRIKSGDKTDLLFEFGYRKTFTDNLDNVTPQYHSLQPSPSNIAATDAGAKVHVGKSDSYFFTTIKLVYSAEDFFHKKKKTATPQHKWLTKIHKSLAKKIAKGTKLETFRKVKFAAIN